MPVLLFSVPASATKHGHPIIVAYEGNCKSGEKSSMCSDKQQQSVHDQIQGNCKDIGSQSWSPITGLQLYFVHF
jgi:hypothetical protein